MLFSFAANPAIAEPERNESIAQFRPGVLLIAFNSGVTESQKAFVLSTIGATEIKRIGVGVHMVHVVPGQELVRIQSLKGRREVRYAEVDFVHRLAGSTLPNDTFASIQWATQNRGQNVANVSGTPGADERTLAAWSITTGTNSVVVAVLDSGLQYTHPDLVTNVWNNPGGIGGCAAGTHGYNVLSANCDPLDDEINYGGHGTHVSGILGAVGNNGFGVAGVNWTTSILPVKWVTANDGGATSDLLTAMDWVMQAKQAGVNVRVINDSATWPGTGFSQALSDEIDLAGSNDILFVTAAGNTAQNNDLVPRYPCSLSRPNMICVGASDQFDGYWPSSNFGANTVNLAAPGTNIFSTLRGSQYGAVNGTSMASPQVAGTAALILSLGYQPVGALKAAILNSVDPLPLFASMVATGGRLNVCRAIPGCSTATASTPVIVSVPVVTGMQQYGSMVGASTGMWAGAPSTYSYQWSRCNASGTGCAPIPGATSANYPALASADIASTLRVSVTASNSVASTTAQSNASSIIANVSSPFAIASTIQDGFTVGGSIQWLATPSQSVSFVQFYIDGVLSQTINGSPYLYNQGASGVLDTTTLSAGSHLLGIMALSADSRTYGFYGATVTVSNTPRINSIPVISGTPAVGQTLSTSTGSWSNNPTSYAYQWIRCDTNGNNCAAIPGAAASSYLVAVADSGATLRSSVTATNASGSGTANSAQVAVGASVAITTNALPGGSQSTPYSTTLAATGGTLPYTWSLISGGLPAGLNLAPSTGVISGTPSGSGTSSFTVQARDASLQTSSKVLSISITVSTGGIALLQSTSTEGLVQGAVSAAFPSANIAGNLIVAFVRMSTASQTVQVTDALGNLYTDAVAQAQSTDGHQIHIFYAKNIAGGANTVTATFSSTNNHPWLGIYEYSGLSTSNPLDRTTQAQGTGTSVSTGNAGTTSSANELIFVGTGFPNSYSGAVTSGSGYTLALQDTNTSKAADETAIVNAAGSYAGTLTVPSSTNWSAVLATFSAIAASSPPTITSSALPGGTVSVLYSATVSATNGTLPYTWSIVSGSLPAGLTLASGTGVISGTPVVAGSSNFTVQVTDAASRTATKALSIAIVASGQTIALVQSKASEGLRVGSISAAFASANKAGNMIVAFVRMSSTGQTVQLTDSAGNVYVDGVSQAQTTDWHQIHILYAANVKGSANTVKATFSATNNHPWLAVYEYSGVTTLDRVASGQGNSTSVRTAATATTTAANELVFAGTGFPNAWGGTVTAGSGYSLKLQDTNTSRAANECEMPGAQGTFSGPFTLDQSANWSAVVATFK